MIFQIQARFLENRKEIENKSDSRVPPVIETEQGSGGAGGVSRRRWDVSVNQGHLRLRLDEIYHLVPHNPNQIDYNDENVERRRTAASGSTVRPRSSQNKTRRAKLSHAQALA
jgi:hypothetical protein